MPTEHPSRRSAHGPVGTTELDEALAYLGVTRLQGAYGDAVTRRSWGELDAMFLPDAPLHLDLRNGTVLELVGGGAIGEFIAGAVERFEFFEFALLNTVVDVDGPDSATGRLYMWELRQDAASGRWTNAYGLYQDRYVRRDGRWRFAERWYHSLARSGSDAVVFDIPDRKA